MMFSGELLLKHAKHLIAQAPGAPAEEEDKAMGLADQRQSLSEAEDRASVAHPGEDAQEAAGKGLLSIAGDKRDRVLGTAAPLTSTHMQCIGFIQQLIDEVTTVSKKCIYQLVFTGSPCKARYEQGAPTCVEAAA